MPTAKGKKLKPSQNKEKGIFRWGLVVWPFLIWAGLSAICFGLDKLDPVMTGPPWERHTIPGNPLEWAPVAWAIIAAGILYIVGTWIIYRHAKHHKRNAVAWTTAAIAFSPVLAGIAYGLTWPKSQ
jgi:hypothetical protein